MSEFSRIVYNFNNRIKLNDTSTDSTKFILVNIPTISDTLIINTEDEKPTDAGIIDYGSKSSKGQLVMPLTLVATSDSNMESLLQTFKQAFNPNLLEKDTTYGIATKYYGYHPLDWSDNVGGTSRDFRIYAKPTDVPKVATDSLKGLVRGAALTLKVADPRKYLQTETTLSGAGTATNAGTYTTPVIITITATGTTSTSLAINNTTTGESLYITTALANNDVLELDTATHSVKLNGVSKRSLLGNNSAWFMLDPGNNVLTLTNDANCSAVFTWRSAWPL